MRPGLSPLDVESTRTGVTRVATNTRLAARDLRNWGLLRYTRAEAFKTWELTHVGRIVGAGLALRGATISVTNRSLRMSGTGSGWLVEPIRDLCRELTDPGELRVLLQKISSPNSDALASMAAIQELLATFSGLTTPDADTPASLVERRRAASDLINRVRDTISPVHLADDVVTDIALRSLIGAYFWG